MERGIPYFKEINILDQLCLKMGYLSSAEALSGYKSFSFQYRTGFPLDAAYIVQMQYKHEEECLFNKNMLCCEQA